MVSLHALPTLPKPTHRILRPLILSINLKPLNCSILQILREPRLEELNRPTMRCPKHDHPLPSKFHLLHLDLIPKAHGLHHLWLRYRTVLSELIK